MVTEVKPPLPNSFLVAVPEDISKRQQRLMKQCAQFVAVNGSKCLHEMTARYSGKNAVTRDVNEVGMSFDFLKPTHKDFGFFTALIEQYSKVCHEVTIGNELMDQLNSQCKSGSLGAILKSANDRLKWIQYQTESKKVLGEQKTKEESDDDVDWQDFVVVQTIDLYDEAQAQKQAEEAKRSEQIKTQLSKIKQEIALQNNFEAISNINTFEPNAALDPNMLVKRDYQRIPISEKERVQQELEQKSKSQPCPKCNQMIQVARWKEHIKICLMDTQTWLQQKQDVEVRKQLPSLAEGQEIANNLKRFASQRPDLYQDLPEVKLPEVAGGGPKVVYDGKHQSLTRTHANVAMIQRQQQRNEEEAAKNKRQKKE